MSLEEPSKSPTVIPLVFLGISVITDPSIGLFQAYQEIDMEVLEYFSNSQYKILVK